MDPRFQLLEWTVEPFANRIVGPAGERRLEPKPMQVLELLARTPGTTVEKDEIFQSIWGGRRLTDDVLQVTVSSLRRSLGDSARNPRFIQTVPGQGYRLIAPVAPAPKLPVPRRIVVRMAAVFAAAFVVGVLFSAPERMALPTTAVLDEGQVERFDEAAYLLRRRDPERLPRALELLEELAGEAPENPSIHVALAEAHLFQAELRFEAEPSLLAAGEAARRALALGDSAAGLALLAQVRFALEWDLDGAEELLRSALELDAAEPLAHRGLGGVLLAKGEAAAAIEHFEHYARLDPHAYPSPFRAFCLAGLGRFDDASRELERLADNVPEDSALLLFHARMRAADDDGEECYRAYDRYYQRVDAGDEVRASLRRRYQSEGLAGVHRFLLERLDEKDRSGLRVSPIDRAAYCVYAGRRDEAFEWLDRAFEERHLGLPYLAQRPAFHALRDDPRFRRFLGRMGML